MRLALLLLAVVLAGCSAPPAPEPEATLLEVAPEPEPGAAAFLAPPPVSPTVPLSVALSIEEPWQRPLRELRATLQAPEGARVAWFASLQETEPRTLTSAGKVFVLKATSPDHAHAPGAPAHQDEVAERARLDVGALPTDGSPATVRAAQPGRYELAAGSARLVVNVWPDAPRDGAPQSFLVGDAFSPAEIDVPSGGRFLLWNPARAPAPVLETSFAPFLAISGAEATLTPIDEGLWRLHALVTDGANGRGFATAPFLVDFEKPAVRREIGPVTGRFTQALAGEPESTRHVFDAPYEIERLDLAFHAASSLPAPGAVRVVLERDGEAIADVSSVETDALRLVDLPPGDYVLRVVAEQGALIGYDIAGEVVYRLPEPQRLRDAR